MKQTSAVIEWLWKQLDIEEIAFKEYENVGDEKLFPNHTDKDIWVAGCVSGIKLMQERMYSEEDMKSAFFNGGNIKDIEEFNYWFEQFKKK